MTPKSHVCSRSVKSQNFGFRSGSEDFQSNPCLSCFPRSPFLLPFFYETVVLFLSSRTSYGARRKHVLGESHEPHPGGCV